MANIKISDLTAKGTNIDSTDLFEISEFNGLIYVSKKITGQEIIDGVSGNITLQIVTNNGNTTDQSISITDGGNLTVVGVNTQVGIGGSSITVDDVGFGKYTALNTDSIVLRTNTNSCDGLIKNDNLTNTNVVLQFPDKVAGDYTIATIDDLTGGYVPYTGATGDVDLGEYELKAGQIELDQSPTGTAGVAVTRWNDSLGSTETTLKGGNVILKNGVDLVARVVNKVTPNTTLTKATYKVVKISGAQGQRLAVAYAQANNDNNSADTLGVVCDTIATNQEGFIMTVGQLEEINTTGSLQGETWADGDVLYLSPTTPGAVTKVKPTGATGHIVVIGYVEYAHAVHGKIYIKIMNGWELDELHNVYINPSTLANNDALIYESSTQLWKNKTIATALGYTPVTDARNLTINGTTANLSADRTFTVTDGNLSTSDITTNNVSTAKHGFAPKAPNDTTKFLRGDATWAAPAVPTLQQVTNQGNTTDQSISITDGSYLTVLGLNTQTVINDSNITVEDVSTGKYTSLNTDSILLRTNLNSYDSYIKNDNVIDTNVVLQFPDKPAGSYTIATTGAITGSGLTMATNRLLGRTTASSGAVEEISVGTGLTLSGTTLSASGLTVGTSSLTSGTVGRILFQGSGNVLQQDASLFWDNTNKRLGVGATPDSSVRLDVRAQGALVSDIAFRVRNSANTGNLAYINGIGDVALSSATINAGAANGTTVAIGEGASVWTGFSQNPIAIGRNANSSGGSIAIGNGASAATGTQSVVNNIAIGTSATTNVNATECIAIGNNTATGLTPQTIAIGAGINFGGYTGRYAIALGTFFNGGNFIEGTYAIGSGVSDASRATLDIADSFSVYFRNNNRSFFVNKNTNIVLRSLSTLTSGTHFDSSATNTFTIHNGTIPTTNIANAGQIYVESGTLRFRDSAGTITNVGGSVQSVASAATVTPVYTNKFVKITAQAAALTLANPTGTWAEGQDLMIRIKDDGTARAITWDTNYRAIGVTLPTTTVVNKTTYVGLIYNSTDGKWDAIGVTTEA